MSALRLAGVLLLGGCGSSVVTPAGTPPGDAGRDMAALDCEIQYRLDLEGAAGWLRVRCSYTLAA
jgi:hypothetical protein